MLQTMTLLLNVLSTSGDSCLIDDKNVLVMEAFGSQIAIPTYLEMLVRIRHKGVLEARFLRRHEVEGDIKLMIILFGEKMEDRADYKSLNLESEYVINGFNVKLYSSKECCDDRKALIAKVGRNDDQAHIVVESREGLDDFLRQALSLDCRS